MREHRATFARVALLVCATASLLASAWAYWEPDAAVLREIDLQRLFVVTVALVAGETLWSILDLRESEDDLERKHFVAMSAGVTVASLLILSPALWWGYQGAFGEREEAPGACPIVDSREGARPQDAAIPGAEPLRDERQPEDADAMEAGDPR